MIFALSAMVLAILKTPTDAQLNVMSAWERGRYMPEYAFKCKFCDYIASTWKSHTQEMIYPICPNCNTQMIRDYRIAGVHFKGTGWGGDK